MDLQNDRCVANSVDPDQMLHAAASDHGILCLLMLVYLNTLDKCGNYIT